MSCLGHFSPFFRRISFTCYHSSSVRVAPTKYFSRCFAHRRSGIDIMVNQSCCKIANETHSRLLSARFYFCPLYLHIGWCKLSHALVLSFGATCIQFWIAFLWSANNLSRINQWQIMSFESAFILGFPFVKRSLGVIENECVGHDNCPVSRWK